MSDTPQTDAAVEAAILQDRNHPRIDWVPASFARELERERDEARELLESEKITRNHIIQRGIEAQKERDEAREAMREAWLAMDETDGTDRMINWQNKYAYILEETK